MIARRTIFIVLGVILGLLVLNEVYPVLLDVTLQNVLMTIGYFAMAALCVGVLVHGISSVRHAATERSIALLIFGIMLMIFAVPMLVKMTARHAKASWYDFSGRGQVKESMFEGAIAEAVAAADTMGYGAGSVAVVEDKTHLDTLIAASTDKPLVVKVFSPGCPPCQMLAPVFKKLASEFGDKATFVEVDVSQGITQENAFPTVIFYKGGKKVNKVVGFNGDESKIRSEINKLI